MLTDKYVAAEASVGTENNSTATAQPASSRWGAFGYTAFTIIWIASVTSNVGTAMFDTASGWLITSLNASPVAVSLVQVAVNLPLFLFTLPAGALADVIDSRRLLIIAEVAIVAISVLFALMVSLDIATPVALLAATFLLGIAGALTSPAWGAIIPLLVAKRDLDGATSANSVGFNLGRAVGPALGGMAIAEFGIALPFWIFALSNVGIIASLLWWRMPRKSDEGLPAERLVSAIRVGIRHSANNQLLRATLMRVLAYFPFASSYLALLPLMARQQMYQGPQLYGILLGAIGIGAILGSLALKWLTEDLAPDQIVATASVGTALSLVTFGLAHEPITAVCACILAGASWTIVLTKLYVSAQVALPDWVRGRGLAIFLTAIFGATTVGSAVWGKLSADHGLPVAYFASAVGVVLGIPLTWGWKLQTGAGLDFSPSLHWRTPKVARKVGNNRGPVLAVVEYLVEAKNRAAFLGAVDALGEARRRDGVYAWGLYEDVTDDKRFVETFAIDSWLELLYQQERVTNADEMLGEQVRRLLVDAPKTTLHVSSERPLRMWKKRSDALNARGSNARES